MARPRPVAAVLVASVTMLLSVTGALVRPTERAAAMAVALWLTTTTAIGAVIARRRRGNAVGWTLVAIGFLGALGEAAEAFADSAVADGQVGNIVETAAWLALWVRVPAFALFPFSLLIFPTGTLLSRRWRPVAWVAGLTAAVGTAAVALSPGRIDAVPTINNPVGISAAPPVLDAIEAVAPGIEIAVAIAAIASLVIRFRRSSGSERHQIGWLMYAGVLLIVALGFAAVAPGPLNELSFVVAVLGLLGIPVAIGIAMLRHRLYDIDVVVNRTIVYAALTICVVVLCIVVVGSMGALFQRRVNLIPALIATGLVAIAVHPLRAILQSMVDRGMYGDRMNPYHALAELGRRLESAYSPRDVLPAIVQTVWVRSRSRTQRSTSRAKERSEPRRRSANRQPARSSFHSPTKASASAGW
jgi:hypothetical protein